MAAEHHRRALGQRREPHTVIIARGKKIRHFNVTRSGLLVTTVIALAITVSCIALPAWQLVKDEVFLQMAERHERERRGYEERIARLRGELDAAASRQMISQKRVETKVEALLGQQDELAERYAMLSPLIEKAEHAGILESDVPLPSPNPRHASAAEHAAATIGDTASNGPVVTGSAAFLPSELRRLPSEALLERIGQAIDLGELRQLEHVETLVTSARTRTAGITKILRSAGVDLPHPSPDQATGGPFEPAPADETFEDRLAALDHQLDELQEVQDIAQGLPFSEPVSAGHRSSGFGVRADPFNGRRALHAGVDYAAASGTPVSTTGPGKVAKAGRSGGYGNMVEIDHGHDIRTRYGHLSRIHVEPGDRVAKGEIIGLVGSTGRSTGPHLHYEVRQKGRAVDPDHFRRLGGQIAALD